MGKLDFQNMVADCFEGLKTNEIIDMRAKEMIKHIEKYKILAKEYLKHGIL